MKTVIVYTFLLSVSFSQALSQTRIGAGINYLALDAPDDMVWMPRLYAEQQLKPRWSVGISAGYIHFKDEYPVISFSVPVQRTRFAIDATVKFAPLKVGIHQFRIGAGPSLWYRDDIRFKSATNIYGTTAYTYETEHIKNWKAGINASLDYTIEITNKSSLMTHFQIVPLALQGLNPNIGLSYLYRIR